MKVKDFLAFFEAKRNGTYKCSFCGSEVFLPNVIARAQTPEEEEVAVLSQRASPASGDFDLVGPAHQFYSFSCVNCGRTDFFHLKQVEDWLKARNGEGSNG